MRILGFHLADDKVEPLGFSASTLDEMTIHLSDGFYTTFSTLNGGTKVLGLRTHLERLYGPARELGLHPSMNENGLRRHIVELVRQNLPGESRIRLVLTRDSGDMYIGIQPFTPPPGEIYEKGVHVITTEMMRHDPRIKGTDFIGQSVEQRKLLHDDIHEILLTHGGKILEGMTSNFYVAQGTVLITAQKGILLGVTRHVVLGLARGEGMSIEYRPPRLDEKFDEALLTSSSRGVVPVVQINGKPVGQGRVGRWAKVLAKAYRTYVGEKSEKIIEDQGD